LIAVSRQSVREVTKRMSLAPDAMKKVENDANGEETLQLMR